MHEKLNDKTSKFLLSRYQSNILRLTGLMQPTYLFGQVVQASRYITLVVLFVSILHYCCYDNINVVIAIEFVKLKTISRIVLENHE